MEIRTARSDCRLQTHRVAGNARPLAARSCGVLLCGIRDDAAPARECRRHGSFAIHDEQRGKDVVQRAPRRLRRLCRRLRLSFAEFGAARKLWLQRLRMSFEERKRELKDEEGDASARGRRRSLHRELLRGGMHRVKEASFVVVNPTHLAIAMAYRPPHIAVPGSARCSGRRNCAARPFDCAPVRHTNRRECGLGARPLSRRPWRLRDTVDVVRCGRRRRCRVASPGAYPLDREKTRRSRLRRHLLAIVDPHRPIAALAARLLAGHQHLRVGAGVCRRHRGRTARVFGVRARIVNRHAFPPVAGRVATAYLERRHDAWRRRRCRTCCGAEARSNSRRQFSIHSSSGEW